ncbi:GTP-binding protein, partial [Rhizobium johnstonii]|uniref:GTP-binding protein n=1 Tax=Rhizobium johnstonii TaxID=3019933 RepID=UPI003F944A96
ADAFPAFTPVMLLTGFLGSGKTTLLRRLLTDPALSNAAVLINEFGEAGLDHHLLERIYENMVLLQSGCLCCMPWIATGKSSPSMLRIPL